MDLYSFDFSEDRRLCKEAYNLSTAAMDNPVEKTRSGDPKLGELLQFFMVAQILSKLSS
jgi:hypothetical protein